MSKHTIIDKEKNANTKKVTESHMRLFTNWLQLNKESRNVEDISPAELDLLLAKYFSVSVKKLLVPVLKKTTDNTILVHCLHFKLPFSNI
jgi:hypothetical protein